MGKKKIVKQAESAKSSKMPKVVENPEGYLKKHPIWAFQRCDVNHEKWSNKLYLANLIQVNKELQEL